MERVISPKAANLGEQMTVNTVDGMVPCLTPGAHITIIFLGVQLGKVPSFFRKFILFFGLLVIFLDGFQMPTVCCLQVIVNSSDGVIQFPTSLAYELFRVPSVETSKVHPCQLLFLGSKTTGRSIQMIGQAMEAEITTLTGVTDELLVTLFVHIGKLWS